MGSTITHFAQVYNYSHLVLTHREEEIKPDIQAILEVTSAMEIEACYYCPS